MRPLPLPRRVGHATVLERIPQRYKSAKYRCRCDCGREFIVWGTSVCNRDIMCFKCKEASIGRFGQSKHPLYEIYMYARKRVKEWRDWNVFIADVGSTYVKGHVIGRKDRTRKISRDNWAWVPKWSECGHGKYIAVNGVTKHMAEWAAVCGITRERMRQRFNKFDPVEAVSKYPKAAKLIRA